MDHSALGLTENYGAIYSGLWGYNSALTAGAIAVTFYVPTLLSAFNAAMAVVFTAAAQRAFGLVLAPVREKINTLSKSLFDPGQYVERIRFVIIMNLMLSKIIIRMSSYLGWIADFDYSFCGYEFDVSSSDKWKWI